MFEGETAHSAGAPWRGRSALDAVELMNVGWNYRREHLRLQQRSHYVVTNGGDQPNVVPRNAGVWYYFRETDYDGIKSMWDIGDKMAQGAALMTNTTWTSRVLGSAWPSHMNRTMAETHVRQHQAGRPADVDRGRRHAGQGDAEGAERAGGRAWRRRFPSCAAASRCRTRTSAAAAPTTSATSRGTCRPCRCRFPANFQAGPGHNWANAIPMATPIAHKGVNAGAKVQAMTLLELMMRPELVTQAKDYFVNVQTKTGSTRRCIRPDDKPAISAEQGDHGPLPAGDEEVLLRPERSTRPTSISSASSTRRCAARPSDGSLLANPRRE